MTSDRPKWIRNEQDDGDRPVCPHCDTPYGDGDIFDVKNYPHDGGAVLFLKCQNCKGDKLPKEAELYFDWETMRKSYHDSQALSIGKKILDHIEDPMSFFVIDVVPHPTKKIKKIIRCEFMER